MPPSEHPVWKPLAMTVIALMVGAAGSLAFSGRAVAMLAQDLHDHENLDGHPAVMAKLEGVEKNQDRIMQMIEALGAKIDRYHGQ